MTDDELRKRIEKALARDRTHTASDVLALIADGKAQLFRNDHGCWITEIMQSPRQRWLNVWIVAGELPGVMDIQEKVIEFARLNNCVRLTATARLGWSRSVAPKYGWHVHSTQIVREV